MSESVSEKSTGDTPQQNNPVAESTQQQVNLLNVAVTDENTALNVLVGFLGLAQKRGAFAINESAKIYECVQRFQRPNPSS